MRMITVAMLILPVFASCHSTHERGASNARGARHRPTITLPFNEGWRIPTTWYCLDGPSFNTERDKILNLAWRLFIATNWPGTLDDKTQKWEHSELSSINEEGVYPQWASWHTPETLFHALNSCSSREPRKPIRTCEQSMLKLSLKGLGFSEDGGRSGPCVYDQEGNVVRHEVRLGQTGWVHNVYGIVCNPEMTPRDPSEPIPRHCGGNHLDLKNGQCRAAGDADDVEGALSIKLAWKKLSSDEVNAGRYLRKNAFADRFYCLDENEGDCIDLGLVGFHIAYKVNDSGNWIWSTFEHVNNLEPPEGGGAASFRDGKCADCSPNGGRRGSDKRCRTQIERIGEIPDDVRRMNSSYRSWLKGSVLEHYQLIGVQYIPTSGRSDADASASKTLPERAEPQVLRNPVIEAFHVCGRESSNECDGDPFEVKSSSSCIGCHYNAQADFSFVIENELCSCKNKKQKLAAKRINGQEIEPCDKLGVFCSEEARKCPSGPACPGPQAP